MTKTTQVQIVGSTREKYDTVDGPPRTVFTLSIRDNSSREACLEVEIPAKDLLNLIGGGIYNGEGTVTDLDLWGWKAESGRAEVTYSTSWDTRSEESAAACAELTARLERQMPGARVVVSLADARNHHKLVRSGEGVNTYSVAWKAVRPPE